MASFHVNGRLREPDSALWTPEPAPQQAVGHQTGRHLLRRCPLSFTTRITISGEEGPFIYLFFLPAIVINERGGMKLFDNDSHASGGDLAPAAKLKLHSFSKDLGVVFEKRRLPNKARFSVEPN